MTESLPEKFDRYSAIYRKEDDDEELVFLATATIENLLVRILKQHLLNSASETDSLFDESRALAGFGSRIHLAYRLGIISQGLYEELQLLRKIRKEFKNKIDCNTLEYAEARAFCKNLKAPASIKAKSDKIRARFPDTHRGNFELTVTIMSCLLEDILDRIGRISRQPLY